MNESPLDDPRPTRRERLRRWTDDRADALREALRPGASPEADRRTIGDSTVIETRDFELDAPTMRAALGITGRDTTPDTPLRDFTYTAGPSRDELLRRLSGGEAS